MCSNQPNPINLMLKLNLFSLMEFLGIKHVKQCLLFVLIILYIYYYDIVIIKGLHGFLLNLVEIITMVIVIKFFNAFAICGFFGMEEIYLLDMGNFQHTR